MTKIRSMKAEKDQVSKYNSHHHRPQGTNHCIVTNANIKATSSEPTNQFVKKDYRTGW